MRMVKTGQQIKLFYIENKKHFSMWETGTNTCICLNMGGIATSLAAAFTPGLLWIIYYHVKISKLF